MFITSSDDHQVTKAIVDALQAATRLMTAQAKAQENENIRNGVR